MLLSVDELAPLPQGDMVHWFISTTGLTMPYYFTSLTKCFYFLKEKEYFMLEKVHLKDSVGKSIKAYQGSFYDITFKCKLTILPRKKNSFSFSI